MSGSVVRRLATVLFIVVAGCSQHRPVAAPSIAPTLTPKPTASAGRYVASPSTPRVSASPTPALTPSPTPAPTAVLAPNAHPRILAITLSTTQFVGGNVVSGTVRTSSNVASVDARIATYDIVVPKTGVGRFELSYRVPNVPFFLHGNYTMQFMAHNARGDRVERDIPISIH